MKKQDSTIDTDLENHNITHIKDSIKQMRNMLYGINSRLPEAEKRIKDQEDRLMENSENNEAKQKRKKLCKRRIVIGNSVTPSNLITSDYRSTKRKERKGQKNYLKK